MPSRPSLPERILCLVTDIERAGGVSPLLEKVRSAVSGGVNMVQVRAHELDDQALYELTASVIEVIERRALIVVNGSSHVAAMSKADGTHFPESAVIDDEAIASDRLIGKSAHSVESAIDTQRHVDYIIAGTVFPSASHPGGGAGGIQLVDQVAAAVDVPVIAIGGITELNARSVISAGARGVAVIGAIINAADPAVAASRLMNEINR